MSPLEWWGFGAISERFFVVEPQVVRGHRNVGSFRDHIGGGIVETQLPKDDFGSVEQGLDPVDGALLAWLTTKPARRFGLWELFYEQAKVPSRCCFDHEQRPMCPRSTPKSRIDLFRECAVAVGDATGVVADQIDHNPIPGIGPIGVVVEFLCSQGNTGHEGERLGEVGEDELPVQSPIDQFPSVGRRSWLSCHGLSLPWRAQLATGVTVSRCAERIKTRGGDRTSA